MKTLASISIRRLLSPFSAVALALLLCSAPSRGQAPANSEQAPATPNAIYNAVGEAPDASTTSPDASLTSGDTAASQSAESAASSESSASEGGSSSLSVLPNSFLRHWVGATSLGVARENGIENDLFTRSTSATYLDGSVSLAYDLPRKHSDYLFDYSASGRHYVNNSQLDAITQDLGLRQAVDLTAETRWVLAYRFSVTPDISNTLFSESLAEKSSLLDPTSAALGGPSQAVTGAVLSPADGLLTVRSTQLSNSLNASLTQQLTVRTSAYFQAGYARVRFEDPNLFGDNEYSIASGVDYAVTPRTSVGLSYQGGRVELVSAFARTTYQSAELVISRRVSRRSVFTLEGGPSFIQSRGQEGIALSPVQASLLGASTLIGTHDSSVGWQGKALFGTNVSGFGVQISYTRAVSGTGGIGGPSLEQTGSLILARPIGRKTNISTELSYSHFQVFAVPASTQFDQEGFSFFLSRRLTRAMESRAFFVYVRGLEGFGGPTLTNRNSVGVRVIYNFHAPVPENSM